jgi:hypothetical protein
LENTCIYGDIIKLNPKEVQCEKQQWAELDKDRFWRRILVNKALKLVLKIERFLVQGRRRFTKKSSIAMDWFINKILNSSEFIFSYARTYIRFKIMYMDNDIVWVLMETR